MPRFAANLTMLFTEVPFMERFASAKDAGFSAIEYLFPYEFEAAELKAQLEQNNLTQVLFNLPAGKWEEGERGVATNPERVEEFRAGVTKAVEYALELGVDRLNCLAGKRIPGYDDDKQWSTLVGNVRYAAKVLQDKGLRLMVEPVNHFDIPGFFLTRSGQALKLIDDVGMPNVFVQYDIYHAQREEGELAATLRKHIDKIGHIQIADNPGRHQPGTGEINYPFIFEEIDASGYRGHVGLEYVPAPDSKSSLAWITEFGYKL
ncbi:MAG TPA: hydroxypyruvate isomerase [Thermodesulfovibrionales bacterium]|nr:hydroxypyruvate isomerase [Thermodesulfovibrionales bacterium]